MNFIKNLHLIIALIFMLTVKISNATQFNGSVDLANVELDEVQVNGSAAFKSSKCRSLRVNGALSFKGLIVSNKIEVNGSADGEDLECSKLIIAGSLEGDNIKVTKDAIIKGFLNVDNSYFEQLEVHSEEIILNDSSTGTIIVGSSKNKFNQTVVLKGKTIVNGDIIFRSDLGEVLLHKQAKITGKVVGGKIVSVGST